VQILNRVTWDNIIKPPHPTELGWKETIRVSPLEDTYVAMRPVLPVLPFDFPNSIRLLSPMMPEGAWIANTTLAEQIGLPIIGFAPNGEPIDITNHYVNFGAEFVYHCHILSHEEMDMMHAVSLTLKPVKPDGLVFNAGTLSWEDMSLSETAFVVEKSIDGGVSWTAVGTIERLPRDPITGDVLADPNTGNPPPNTTGEVLSFPISEWSEGNQFRVVAVNMVGDTHYYGDPNLNEILPGEFAFPVFTARSISEVVDTTPPPAVPEAPTDLTATAETGPQVRLTWTDNASNETGFVIERATDGVTFSVLANLGDGATSYVDMAVTAGGSYDYRVAAVNAGGTSAYAGPVHAAIPGPQAPAAPDSLEANFEDVPLINLAWNDNALDETSFVIQRSTDGVTFTDLATVGADITTYDDLAVLGNYTYTYQVAAVNANGTSAYAASNSVLVPADATPPATPSNLAASNVTSTSLTLTWVDNSNNEMGFTIQRATNSSFSRDLVTVNVGADVTSFNDTGLRRNTTYYYRILAFNLFNDGTGPFPWSPVFNIRAPR
jgi:fibronectin type 3 domain-containing protein